MKTLSRLFTVLYIVLTVAPAWALSPAVVPVLKGTIYLGDERNKYDAQLYSDGINHYLSLSTSLINRIFTGKLTVTPGKCFATYSYSGKNGQEVIRIQASIYQPQRGAVCAPGFPEFNVSGEFMRDPRSQVSLKVYGTLVPPPKR